MKQREPLTFIRGHDIGIPVIRVVEILGARCRSLFQRQITGSLSPPIAPHLQGEQYRDRAEEQGRDDADEDAKEGRDLERHGGSCKQYAHCAQGVCAITSMTPTDDSNVCAGTYSRM